MSDINAVSWGFVREQRSLFEDWVKTYLTRSGFDWERLDGNATAASLPEQANLLVFHPAVSASVREKVGAWLLAFAKDDTGSWLKGSGVEKDGLVSFGFSKALVSWFRSGNLYYDARLLSYGALIAGKRPRLLCAYCTREEKCHAELANELRPVLSALQYRGRKKSPGNREIDPLWGEEIRVWLAGDSSHLKSLIEEAGQGLPVSLEENPERDPRGSSIELRINDPNPPTPSNFQRNSGRGSSGNADASRRIHFLTIVHPSRESSYWCDAMLCPKAKDARLGEMCSYFNVQNKQHLKLIAPDEHLPFWLKFILRCFLNPSAINTAERKASSP